MKLRNNKIYMSGTMEKNNIENLIDSEGDLAHSQETPVGDVSLEVGAGSSREDD